MRHTQACCVESGQTYMEFAGRMHMPKPVLNPMYIWTDLIKNAYTSIKGLRIPACMMTRMQTPQNMIEQRRKTLPDEYRQCTVMKCSSHISDLICYTEVWKSTKSDRWKSVDLTVVVMSDIRAPSPTTNEAPCLLASPSSSVEWRESGESIDQLIL